MLIGRGFQHLSIQAILNFVRRRRAKFATEVHDPEAFCVALIADRCEFPFAVPILELLRPLDDELRNYAISSLYALLIGHDRRKALSAYFTPPSLVAAAMRAADPFLRRNNPWVLDPACGGGSFLAPVALHLIRAKRAAGLTPSQAVGKTLQ